MHEVIPKIKLKQNFGSSSVFYGTCKVIYGIVMYGILIYSSNTGTFVYRLGACEVRRLGAVFVLCSTGTRRECGEIFC